MHCWQRVLCAWELWELWNFFAFFSLNPEALDVDTVQSTGDYQVLGTLGQDLVPRVCSGLFAIHTHDSWCAWVPSVAA